jgi:Tfp pilus assembly protein PilO
MRELLARIGTVMLQPDVHALLMITIFVLLIGYAFISQSNYEELRRRNR